jgi:ABC-type Fe3+/spermidine/putrescine transport system ATPase subunit
MDAVAELRGVSKRFPQHVAVDNVSLAIPRGALFTLIGPSGCGKTTVLRLIAGFEQPNAGEVLLNGVSIGRLRPYERNVTTVFQNYALFPHLTARQNIEFGLRRRRASNIDDAVKKVLELVRLAGKEHRHPSQMSGGERQRVALARALVLEPEVLLLDEPLSALDPKLRKQVRIELKALQRRVGITFLLVTHDQEEALSMSDRIALMNRGRIEQVGSPEDIYLRPATRFVAAFLGAVNWMESFGVRPETTRISVDPPEQGRRSHPATIRQSTFLGNCIHVETALDTGQTVVAEIPRDNFQLSVGQRVHVWWERDDEMHLSQEPA